MPDSIKRMLNVKKCYSAVFFALKCGQNFIYNPVTLLSGSVAPFESKLVFGYDSGFVQDCQQFL